MFTGDNGNAKLRKYYRTLQERTANAFGKQSTFIKEKASEKVNELKGGIAENITKATTYTFGSIEWDKWQTCNKVSQRADKILGETRKLGEALAGIQRIVNETINYASDCKQYREKQIMRALEIQDPNVSKVLYQRNIVKENINETVLDGKTKLCDNYTNRWMRRVNCATTTFERKDFVKEEPQPPGIFQSVGKFVRNCFENAKEKVFPRNYCDSNSMQVGEQENDLRAPTRILTIENSHDVPLELRRPLDSLALVDEMNQFAKESLNNLNEKMSKKISTYLKSTSKQIRNTLADVKAKSDDALKLILAGSSRSTSDKDFPNLDEWQAITVNNQYITAVVQSQQKFEANLKEISKTSQRALKNNRKDLTESILYAAKELDELAVRLENLGGSVCVSLEDVRSSVLSLYSQAEDFGVECKNSMSEAIGEYKGKVTEKAKTMAVDCKCNLMEMKTAVIECGKAELVRHICTVNRKLEQKETESDEEKRPNDPIEALYETLSICKSQIDETREFKKKCISKAKEEACTYFNNFEETFIENVKEFKEKVDGLVQSASEQIESVMEDVSAAGGSIKKEIEHVMVKTQEKVEVVKKKAVKVKDNVTKQLENAKKQFMEELNDAKRTAESYYANLDEHVQQIRENFQKEWEKCMEESERNNNNDNERCNCGDCKD